MPIRDGPYTMRQEVEIQAVVDRCSLPESEVVRDYE